MAGGGADIYNTADEFWFASMPLSGNGTIVAKVDSIVDAHAWAKCGVTIRESLDPDSRFAAVYATPGNGVRFQAWRIPFSEVASAGVNMGRVQTIRIGIGDRNNPAAGGSGLIYIDDTGFGHALSSE